MKEFEVDGEKRLLDEDCVCIHSELCYWLSGRDGCEHCYVATLKSDEQKEEAVERWKETLALLPTGVDELHETDQCQFCKREQHKATEYGVFEMAHEDPYFEKGMFFGFGKKMRTPVGSLISMQAAICPECKRAFRMVDIIQIAGLLVGIVLGIVLLMIPAISQPMYNLFPLLPVGFLVLMAVAGHFIGKQASTAHYKKVSEMVRMNLSDIPIIAIMLNRGWFFFQMSEDHPRISFVKRKQFERLLRREKKQTIEDITNDDDTPLDNMNI